MASNPPDDVGIDTTESTPTSDGTTPPTPSPGIGDKIAGLAKQGGKAVLDNVRNQLSQNLGKAGGKTKEEEEEEKKKKGSDYMQLVDSLSDTVAGMNGAITSAIGNALQKGFNNIVGLATGNGNDKGDEGTPDPDAPGTDPTPPKTGTSSPGGTTPTMGDSAPSNDDMVSLSTMPDPLGDPKESVAEMSSEAFGPIPGSDITQTPDIPTPSMDIPGMNGPSG